jgi:hypothetical protein
MAIWVIRIWQPKWIKDLRNTKLNLLKTNCCELGQFPDFHWGQPGKIANEPKNTKLENCSVTILWRTWRQIARKSKPSNYWNPSLSGELPKTEMSFKSQRQIFSKLLASNSTNYWNFWLSIDFAKSKNYRKQWDCRPKIKEQNRVRKPKCSRKTPWNHDYPT